MSLWAFQDNLKALGHFYTVYKNVDDLKLQFNQELDKLAANGFIEFNPEKELAPASPAVHIETKMTGGVAGVVGAQKRCTSVRRSRTIRPSSLSDLAGEVRCLEETGEILAS